jgi:pimeloyl-ACP methyl ester carboxylesterase
MKVKIIIILFLSLPVLTGCGVRQMNRNYDGPEPLPDHLSQRFDYDNYVEQIKSETTTVNDTWTINRIELARGKQDDSNIVIDYYSVEDNGVKPVVVLLPILGGDNIVAKKFAEHLAENGMPGIIVHRKEDIEENFDIDRMDEMSEVVVTDVRKVMDWIETEEELDASQVGLMGVSLGGISSALITAVEPRIKASMILLAAGDLPYIIAYSKEKKIIARRNEYMAENRLTQETLYQKLKQNFSNDPMTYAEYTDARKVVMMLAVFDNVVPFHKGRELRQKMGNPKTYYLLSGHYTSGVYLPWVKWFCVRFFREQLSRAN